MGERLRIGKEKSMGKHKRVRLRILRSLATGEEDKRVFCRFAIPEVPMRFKDLKVGDRGEGVCADMSGGGASIVCAREVKAKTPLEMWFDLSDGFEPMHLLGKIAWARREGGVWRAGVAFDRQRLITMARIMRLE